MKEGFVFFFFASVMSSHTVVSSENLTPLAFARDKKYRFGYELGLSETVKVASKFGGGGGRDSFFCC